jgi:type II secretory pathway component PulC
MAPAFSRDDLLRLAGRVSIALCVCAGLYLVHAYASLPASVPEAATPEPEPLEWPEIQPMKADWSVFQAGEGRPIGTDASAGRFRLIGTFFVYHIIDGPSVRKAVLDDRREKTQHIVQEGDTVDEIEVVRVFHDHVILRDGDEEGELWMSFSGSADAAATAPSGEETQAEARPAKLGESWFGERQAPSQWAFRRDRLMAYYQELMDEPDRLVAMFDSLRPLYTDGRRINGYVLDVAGERDFFEAVGLREGDVVRKVNSMAMTNRRRAEFFVTQFVKNQANAFVIEIEREGKPQKLIYQVR